MNPSILHSLVVFFLLPLCRNLNYDFDMENRICKLFGIKYPIISGGMVWCSGWKLASAVSNNGGLGLIGAGSMHPEVLREHIQKTKQATDKPFGVNVPLFYPELDTIMNIIAEEKVPGCFYFCRKSEKIYGVAERARDNCRSCDCQLGFRREMRRSRSGCHCCRRF